MCSKAKFKCRSDVLNVNSLKNSYLNLMKFENRGTAVECWNKNLTKGVNLCFSQQILLCKWYKNGRPHFGILVKTRLNAIHHDLFCYGFKKLTNFNCEYKQLQVCFPSSCATFLIVAVKVNVIYQVTKLTYKWWWLAWLQIYHSS
jgi:hypothetical protein